MLQNYNSINLEDMLKDPKDFDAAYRIISYWAASEPLPKDEFTSEQLLLAQMVLEESQQDALESSNEAALISYNAKK